MVDKASTHNAPATFILEGKLRAEQPLATCSKDLSDRAAAEAGRRPFPTPVPSCTTDLGKRLYFPASGIRGKLRRAMRDIVRERVMEITDNPTPFDLSTHFYLTLGGIKGAGESEKSTVGDHLKARENNPLLSIFGAGDAGVLGFVGGRLSVGNAICTEASEPTVFSGARTDDVYRDTDQTAYLSQADILQLTGQSQMNRERSKLRQEIRKTRAKLGKARAEGALDEAIQALTDEAKGLDDRLAEMEVQAKEDGGSTNSVGMPLPGWQAIPQGAEMEQRMILRRSNELELSFLLNAISQFGMEPILGAHFNAGNGLVSGEWTVYRATRKGKELMGVVRFTPFEPLAIEGESTVELERILGHFDTFMDNGEWSFEIPEFDTEKGA